MKNPSMAAGLSAVWCGLGQMYNGRAMEAPRLNSSMRPSLMRPQNRLAGASLPLVEGASG